MGLGLFLGILLIYHVLPLPLSLSAEEETKSTDTTCPENFPCGNLTNQLGFPFFDSSHPSNCGLFMLNCEAEPAPKIAFGFQLWQWFSVINVNHSVITLHDNELEQHLQASPQHLLGSRNCDVFFDSDYKHLPKSSGSISYSILHNITLYRCKSNPSTSQRPTDDIFQGYQKYSKCDDDVIIYYQIPGHPAPGKLDVDGTIQAGCMNATLPMVWEDDYSSKTDLFELLTPEFDLEWHLSGNCSTCYSEGLECWVGWNLPGDPHCAYFEKGNKHLSLILPIVIPVSASVVIVLALLFIWRRKKKMNYISHLLSRKTSEPSSNQDLEVGSIFFGVPVFSYSELEAATNSFDASKELGDGGFGTVYFGKLRDGREVAVKRLYEHNFKRMEQFMNEIQILTRLRHRNLVTLYGCTSRRCRELLLVYEYIPNGTVADHLHGDRAKDKYLTWQHRMNIAIETADALAYLHKSDIIHRDVKTNNILLDHNFCVKVADFGLSRLFPNDVSHISTAPQGTPGYVDPEYHQCYQLTDKSDVYSFGVVLIELISSMPAVDISRHRHEINLANLAINRIQRCAFDELIDSSLEYKSDTEVWRMTTSVAELAFRCLQLEKDMRPKMEEVLETLKDIQNCKDTLIDKTAETDEKAVESRRATAASPESEDIVLLKNVKSPSSPNSVADVWASGSSTTSASR